jgi:ubiquinone/menaquinone biosynthesis C-methylase UbiE
MDFHDYKNGMNEENFYFEGKKELLEKLLKKLNLKKKIKILSIGAGTGEEVKVLKNYGDVYIIDVNKEVINSMPKEYKNKFVMDARKLKFKNEMFDLIVALDVIEHIEGDIKVVNEIKRVLKKDGTILMSVPAFQQIYSKHDAILGHVKRYSKKEVRELFKEFKVKRLFYWDSILLLPVALIRIIQRNSTKVNPDYFQFNKIIDKLLLTILRIENNLVIRKITLPFGLTIVGIFKK